MSRAFSRRELLVAGGVTAAGAVGGCLGDNPESPSGHIYIENTSSGARQLALAVTERTDGTPRRVAEGRYEIPEGYALQMEGVLEPGQTYAVRAALESPTADETTTHVVNPCDEGTDGGERVVSVRTRPDGLGVIPMGCQEEYTRRELEYAEASEYRVGTVSGTVAA